MRYSITLTVLAGLLAIQAGFAPQSSEAQNYRRSRAQSPRMQSYRPDTRQVIVPGTGTLIDYVGDTFEDPEWGFVHNMPEGAGFNVLVPASGPHVFVHEATASSIAHNWTTIDHPAGTPLSARRSALALRLAVETRVPPEARFPRSY